MHRGRMRFGTPTRIPTAQMPKEAQGHKDASMDRDCTGVREGSLFSQLIPGLPFYASQIKGTLTIKGGKVCHTVGVLGGGWNIARRMKEVNCVDDVERYTHAGASRSMSHMQACCCAIERLSTLHSCHPHCHPERGLSSRPSRLVGWPSHTMCWIESHCGLCAAINIQN